ncbi:MULTISPECIES: MerR family transcriptional regulator [unclassified Aureimonas]|jgi:DNA-binding transcriptional MerR regulator|uniref:MerR family transcriptional regulator n=1 Tax=unclassified Aureimonas TaxID=2615206 RepID=UPI0006FCBEB1|nr:MULTISPECIES: helix-turn-helix domain-containing protein [unclassified Aureimonas]KQT56199.1 MerR family transcriptional regulator [Aureimonas sp. Leaf427]KQT73225.1 MerR family transcriptional regulator [Aureimonas sp. Leaf460]
MKTGVPIGAASKASGIKVPTIRYYEEIGLLPTPPRTEGNRRLYDAADMRRLRFIRHARELGFEIAPIRELLAMAGEPDRPCEGADGIARAHLADIDHKIARLTALRTEVARMADCTNHSVADCRVIEVLGDHGECLHETH